MISGWLFSRYLYFSRADSKLSELARSDKRRHSFSVSSLLISCQDVCPAVSFSRFVYERVTTTESSSACMYSFDGTWFIKLLNEDVIEFSLQKQVLISVPSFR